MEIVRCIVCKRKLKAEKSIARKMGDTCARKLHKGYCGIQIEQFQDIAELEKALK